MRSNQHPLFVELLLDFGILCDRLNDMMLWNDKPYHSLDYELKKRYGEKIYRLALNGGMSCPNRDGSVGTGGCIFCSAGGSGDFAADPSLSVREQIRQARERLKKNVRPVVLSPIFRHIPIPMPLSPVCAPSSWRQSSALKLCFCPLPPAGLPGAGSHCPPCRAEPDQTRMGGAWTSDHARGYRFLHPAGIPSGRL